MPLVDLTVDQVAYLEKRMRAEGQRKRSRRSFDYCRKGTLGYELASFELELADTLLSVLAEEELTG